MSKIITNIIRSKNAKSIISFLKENKRTILTLLVISIFADAFFIKASLDIITFGTLLLYGIFINIYQIKSKTTFLLCLAILIAMSIDYLLTGASVSTEKAAVWFILFLVVGVIQQWKE